MATWAATHRSGGSAARGELIRQRGQAEIQGEEERRAGVRHRFNNPGDPWYGSLNRQDRRRVELGLWAPQAHSRSVSRREWTRIWIWFNRWACRIPHREERPLSHPDPNHPSHIPELHRIYRNSAPSGPSAPPATPLGSIGTPTMRSAHRNYRLRNQALSRSYAVLRNSRTEPDTETSDPVEEAALIAALLASLDPALPADQASPPSDLGRAASSDQASYSSGARSTLPPISEEDDTGTSGWEDRTNRLAVSSVSIPESLTTWGAYTTPDRTGLGIRRGARGGVSHRHQRPRHG